MSAAAALLAATSGSFNFSSSPTKSMDSYCEICKKNLCNRYFLKTHMLKKHGISTADLDGNATSASPVKSSFPGNVGAEGTQTPQSVIVSRESPFANFQIKQMDSKNSVLENFLCTSQPSRMEQQKTPVKSTPPNLHMGSQMQHQFKYEPPAEDVHSCTVCDKEFDSRLNLLQHQLLQHADMRAMRGSTPQFQSNSNGMDSSGGIIGGNVLPMGLQLPFAPSQFGDIGSAEGGAQAVAALMAKLGGAVEAANQSSSPSTPSLLGPGSTSSGVRLSFYVHRRINRV